MVNDQLKAQYDSLYASTEGFFGEGKPVPAVVKLLKYIQSGTVLDIGGGDGRNALFLAENGFQVTVTDISLAGLNKITEKVTSQNLSIVTKIADATLEPLEGQYDVILVSFVLFHLGTETARELIKKMKEHTAPGGFNIHVTFAGQGELFERNQNKGRFYPSEAIFKELYVDWDIRELATYEIEAQARHKDGTRLKNQVVALIAQKTWYNFHMTNQQLLTLVFTFIVGMFSGAYLYMTSFAPEYASDGFSGEVTEESLGVIGEQTGGCQMGARACASFRLTGNRQYEYIPAHPLGTDTPQPLTGKVSVFAMDNLKKVLTVTDFEALTLPGDTCQAAFDGIDYKYTILLNGETYELDSCGTSFYGTRLYNELLILWGQMLKEEASGESETGEVRGPAEVLIDRFGSD